MTREQLKDALGFTKSYVNRKIREGLPTETVEATREWLEKNARLKVGSYAKNALKAAVAVLPVDGSVPRKTLSKRCKRTRGA